MNPVHDLIAAFRAQMGAAWPETLANGIWDRQEALRRSFEEDFKFPYAIIDVRGLRQSDRDGLRNRAWRPPFALYYVAETEGDTEALTERLEALAEHLDASDLAFGQIIPPTVDIAVGDELEPNALLILLNATQRAGQVSGTVACGYTR